MWSHLKSGWACPPASGTCKSKGKIKLAAIEALAINSQETFGSLTYFFMFYWRYVFICTWWPDSGIYSQASSYHSEAPLWPAPTPPLLRWAFWLLLQKERPQCPPRSSVHWLEGDCQLAPWPPMFQCRFDHIVAMGFLYKPHNLSELPVLHLEMTRPTSWRTWDDYICLIRLFVPVLANIKHSIASITFYVSISFSWFCQGKWENVA